MGDQRLKDSPRFSGLPPVQSNMAGDEVSKTLGRLVYLSRKLSSGFNERSAKNLNLVERCSLDWFLRGPLVQNL